MLRRRLLAISALTLTGCSILPERPALKYYGFMLQPPKQGTRKKFLGSLMVNQPQVAEPYNETKFYILGEGGRFYGTEVNRFISPPADLIGAAIRQWVSLDGPFKTVLLPNSIANADYQMVVYVSKLYADTITSPSQTIIDLGVSVIRTSNCQEIFRKSFSEMSPVAQPTIQAMMESYTKGLENILTSLCSDLNRSLRGR